MVFLFGVGCSEKWKEEVQLSDGRIIIVEREMQSERGGDELAFNRSGTKPKKYSIQFIHPDESGKLIKWSSTKMSSSGTWPEIPLILNIELGHPIIYSLAGVSAGCEVYSKYIYRNGIWIEEALPDKFKELMSNLYARLHNDMPKYVDLETKRKWYSNIRTRRAVKQVGPMRKVCV